MPGIFFPRKGRLVIPKGGLVARVDEDGTTSFELKAVQVGFDLALFWLDLAQEHLERARDSTAHRRAIWDASDDPTARGLAIEDEMKSAMQSIVAACTAIDALYAEIKSRTSDANRSTRTRDRERSKEVERLFVEEFGVTEPNARSLGHALQLIYRFRNQAVHPTPEPKPPSLHPELQLQMEWRYISFSTPNAEEIVGATTSLFRQAKEVAPRARNEAVRQYLDAMVLPGDT